MNSMSVIAVVQRDTDTASRSMVALIICQLHAHLEHLFAQVDDG